MRMRTEGQGHTCRRVIKEFIIFHDTQLYVYNRIMLTWEHLQMIKISMHDSAGELTIALGMSRGEARYIKAVITWICSSAAACCSNLAANAG